MHFDHYRGEEQGAAQVKPLKKTFSIKITYFKPSGKYYTDTTVDRDVRVIGTNGCNMNDVVAWLRGHQRDGGGGLPGLRNGTWHGPIMVDCSEGYPCLILPQGGDLP